MVCDSSSTFIWDFYLNMSIKAMTWQRDTVQLFLASGRDPFLRNVFFLLYWSFSSHVCARLLSEKHHKCQSVFLNASWKLFYDEQLPFSVFSQSDFSCNSAQIYILNFLFSQHELYSSQRTAVFPALSIRGKRNGQNRMSFFFMQVITLTENTVSQGCIAPLSKLFSVEELRPNLWLRDFWTSWIKLSV